MFSIVSGYQRVDKYEKNIFFLKIVKFYETKNLSMAIKTKHKWEETWQERELWQNTSRLTNIKMLHVIV